MKLIKFNSNTRDEVLLMFYQSKILKELQTIKPKWAYGPNIKEALQDFNDDYEIFLVKSVDLIFNAEMYEVSTEILFTGADINDRRITRILHRWDNGKFIDPPTIGLSKVDSNRISFSDGRHRANLAYFLEYFQIPVLVYKPDIDAISKILKLTLP